MTTALTTTLPKLTGLKAEIVELVKKAGPNGMTTDQLKAAIPHRNGQTVNSTTNALAKADILKDSGERRETSSGGGRPAIVYVFNPNAKPKPKKPAKVVDFGERKLFATIGAMIDDRSLAKAIEHWKKGKTFKQRVLACYEAMVVPMIDNSRGAIVQLANVQTERAQRDGRLIDFGALNDPKEGNKK